MDETTRSPEDIAQPTEEQKPKKHTVPVHEEPGKEYFAERTEQELLADIQYMAPKALYYFLNPIKRIRDSIQIPIAVQEAVASRWLWYSQHGRNYMLEFGLSTNEILNGDKLARKIEQQPSKQT